MPLPHPTHNKTVSADHRHRVDVRLRRGAARGGARRRGDGARLDAGRRAGRAKQVPALRRTGASTPPPHPRPSPHPPLEPIQVVVPLTILVVAHVPRRSPPLRCALLAAQFTDIDTQGHGFGVSAQYETATRASVVFVRDFMQVVIPPPPFPPASRAHAPPSRCSCPPTPPVHCIPFAMQAMPENSVLLTLSDHGHEAGGGTGGGSESVSKVPRDSFACNGAVGFHAPPCRLPHTPSSFPHRG